MNQSVSGRGGIDRKEINLFKANFRICRTVRWRNNYGDDYVIKHVLPREKQKYQIESNNLNLVMYSNGFLLCLDEIIHSSMVIYFQNKTHFHHRSSS